MSAELFTKGKKLQELRCDRFLKFIFNYYKGNW